MKHLALLLLLALAGTPALAAPAPDPGRPTRVTAGGFTFDLGGEYRIDAARVGALPILQAEPGAADAIPVQRFLEHRLLFAPGARWESTGVVRKVGVVSEIVLTDGVVMGSFDGREPLRWAGRPRLGVDSPRLENVDVRQLYASLVLPPVALRVGRQLSEWGGGMLANGGATRFDDLRFGFPRTGDVVDRAELFFWPLLLAQTSRPKALLLTFAGDRVVRDALADRARDDDAWQLLSTVAWHDEAWEAGVFYLYRRQSNALDDRTTAHVVDAFGRYEAEVGEVRLRAAAEVALLAGATEATRTPTHPGAADVLGLGATLEGSAEWRMLQGALEAGYASGDSDPTDDRFAAFSFHPDHRVGLVLFPELLGAASAVQATNAANPTFAASPARGFDQLPTDGAVTDAVYLFPRVSVRPLAFLDVMGGFLAAWGACPVTDPFWSNVSGRALGPFGGPAARFLGWEVDGALRLTMHQGPVQVTGVLEGGYLQPGEAFADARGDTPGPVSLMQARLHVSW